MNHGGDTPLDRLFGSTAAFIDHHRKREILRHRTSGFGDLIDIAAVDRLIGAGVLRVPFDARMANLVGGTTEETAERWREAMRGTSPERFDPDEAVAGFDRGDTIVLHGLHRRIPEIDRFAYDLESQVGQMIDVNAFLTPPNAQGLDAHYDHHDVIIAQVHGTKAWQLWEPTVLDPLPEYAPDQFETRGERHDITLEEGDVLYVPRGWTHCATTPTSTSLHLTIGMIPLPWLEVAHSFLASLDREEPLRRSLPFGYHRDPETLVDGITEAVGVVRSAIDACDVEVAAKELSESMVARRSTRVGRLSEIVGAHAVLQDNTRVKLGSQALDSLRRGAPSWQVEINHVVLDLPELAEQALEHLHAGGSVELCQLVGEANESAVRLVRQLMRHGILAPAEDRGTP